MFVFFWSILQAKVFNSFPDNDQVFAMAYGRVVEKRIFAGSQFAPYKGLETVVQTFQNWSANV